MSSNVQSITIERAAEILRISRECLDKLISDGTISEHKIGDARCVHLREILAYAEARNKERAAALNRISQDAAEAGLYDSNKFPEDGQDE